VEAGRSPNIEIVTSAEVIDVQGSAGDFTVKVLRHPRYVNPAKCTGCGFCSPYCPVQIPDPFNRNLSHKKAVDILYTQAVPSTYYVEPDYCLFLTKKQCKQCTRACQSGAIDFTQRPETVTYRVGAMILSTGFQEINRSFLKGYGYGDFPNVVTGMEFELYASARRAYLS
jgi:heterodisulfide reductase subunit A